MKTNIDVLAAFDLDGIFHTPVQKVNKRARYAKPLFLPNNIIMCDTSAFMPGREVTCVMC